jgi:hypothetical protein
MFPVFRSFHSLLCRHLYELFPVCTLADPILINYARFIKTLRLHFSSFFLRIAVLPEWMNVP